MDSLPIGPWGHIKEFLFGKYYEESIFYNEKKYIETGFKTGNGLKFGKSCIYNDARALVAQNYYNYKNGETIKSVKLFPDGNKSAEMIYKNYKSLIGKIIYYNTKGVKISKSYFVQGNKTASKKYFYKKDKLYQKIESHHLVSFKIFKKYYTNGNIMTLKTYRNGRLHGRFNKYNRLGKLLYSVLYNNDSPIRGA
jgi:antitoxin component YwqK of YwqJK toxin-antitoxin module